MRNRLIALIAGPTDKSKIFRFGNISKEDYQNFLIERGIALSRHISQINIIPDDGVPLDIARAYKESGGSKVVGYFPKGGCVFLEKNYHFCDEVKEFDAGWSGLNTCLSLKGNIMIVFGLSPGTLVEVAYTKYHKKYLKRIVPVLIDRNTIDGRMPPELMDELKFEYFASNNRLLKLLERHKK